MSTTTNYVCRTCKGKVVFPDTVHEHEGHEIYKMIIKSIRVDGHEINDTCEFYSKCKYADRDGVVCNEDNTPCPKAREFENSIEPVKIYIASSFSLVDKVQVLSDMLEDAGHEITVKWWAREYEIEGEDIHTTELKVINDSLDRHIFNSLKETRFSYWDDLNGVLNCDAFIFLADDEPRKYNGASVELGIALGHFKACFLLGELENSVLFSQLIYCENIPDLLSRLDNICDMVYTPLCQHYKGKTNPCKYGSSHGVNCPFIKRVYKII